jgi:hypothetical protein
MTPDVRRLCELRVLMRAAKRVVGATSECREPRLLECEPIRRASDKMFG